eukprot:jgi/Chlat1/4400/Chrsp29S04537
MKAAALQPVQLQPSVRNVHNWQAQRRVPAACPAAVAGARQPRWGSSYTTDGRDTGCASTSYGSSVSFAVSRPSPSAALNYGLTSHHHPSGLSRGSSPLGGPTFLHSCLHLPAARRRLRCRLLRRPQAAYTAVSASGQDGLSEDLTEEVASQIAAANSAVFRRLARTLERTWQKAKSSGFLALCRKVAPLALLFFCASFNYSLLRDTKDALVITARGGGVEQVPFLTTYFVLPLSVLYVMWYSWLCSSLPSHLVFYAAITPFLLYFGLFVTVLYPMQGVLHPHQLADRLLTIVPPGFHGLVSILRNWTFSLFYITGELWGGVVISLLFWGLANEVCTMEEARTVYPLLGISANIALVVAGRFLKNIARMRGSLASAISSEVAWGRSLRILVGAIMAGSAVMCATHYYIQRQLVPSREAEAKKVSTSKKSKPKLSFKESFSVLVDSPQIRNLALVVVAYGVSTSLFDVSWKHQLRQLYRTPQAYGGVLAEVSTATGVLTICSMLLSRFVFSWFGWGVAAAATPTVMMLTGAVFFMLSMAAPSAGALATAVTAGAVQQALAKAAKYSLFDPAKEMVFISLNKEDKTKGKAAVDLVGSQLGKSGGSWITQALLLGVGSLSTSLPVIAGVYGIVILLWLNAARELHMLLMNPPASAEELAAQGADGSHSPLRPPVQPDHDRGHDKMSPSRVGA